MLACDAVVASRRGVFGFPEAARGVLASCAGLFRGPRALPLNVARTADCAEGVQAFLAKRPPVWTAS